jgi:hypothetical protein
VVLKDASGNTIKTVDPVNVADGAASASIVEQTFTGDNSTTAFTVTGVYETNPANFLIHIDGVYQPISSSYSLSLVGANTRVTFTSAPPTGAVILIRAYSVAALGETGPPATVTFKFSTTTTDADPGAGYFRLNNATIASATQMFVSDTSFFGAADVSAWVQSWDDSTNASSKGLLTLRSVGALSYFGIFKVTGTITDAVGYTKVTIAHVSSSGTWVADDEMSIDFSVAGDQSTDGRIPTVTAAGNAMIAAANAAAQTALLSNFVGDSGSGGTKGLVPAPASGDTAAGKFLKADATWATLVSGSLNVQTFSANGTWTKPSNAQLSLIMLVGGGGGGGSGGNDIGSASRGGGSGGGGAKLAVAFIVSSSLGSTETVTIATGGAGGGAQAANADGNNGSAGGTSTFGAWLSAFGGGGGGGGGSGGLVRGGIPGGDMETGATAPAGGSAPGPTSGFTSQSSSGTATFGSGTPGGAGNSYGVAPIAGYAGINGPTGGGGGGGGAAAAAGGALRGAAGGTGGGTGATGGTGNASTTHPSGTGGGGGGQSGASAATSGGAGGAGVRGGGGGGGGAKNSSGAGSSGAGAAGGDGYCVVYTWCFA